MQELRRVWKGRHYSNGRNDAVTTAVIKVASAVVDKSGVLERLNEWDQQDRAALQRHAGGRPRKVQYETALTMWVVLALLRQNWRFTTAAEHLENVFTDDQLLLLGVHPDSIRGLRAGQVYERLWRACERMFTLMDSEPGPRRRALSKIEAHKVQLGRDPAMVKMRRARRTEVMNRLVHASTYLVPRDVRRKMLGVYAVDATVLKMPGRTHTKRSTKAATIPDAGWYVRNPEEPDHGHNGSDANGNKRRTVGKYVWGMEVEVVQAGRPTGAKDDHPLLIHGMNWHKPASAPAAYAAETFRWMADLDPTMPCDYIAADMLYLPNASIDTFQGPMRALGYRFAMDYPVAALGVQDQYGGAQLVDGTWYGPCMPQSLIDATANHAAGIIDDDTLMKQIAERSIYAVRAKEAADDDGMRKYRCPGASRARTIDCPIKPSTTGHPTKRLLPILLPVNRDRICTNVESLTIPPLAGLKYRQDFAYLSPEWQAAYHGPRNTVEGVNRRIKSGAEENLRDSDSRLSRSLTAQCIFAVTAVIAVNCTRTYTWLNDQQNKNDQALPAPATRSRAKPRAVSLKRYDNAPTRAGGSAAPPGQDPKPPTAA